MSGALTWRESGALRAASVGRDQPATVGRADGADVRVDDPSVSREQAIVRFDGTGFVLANRSRTNPTRVNEVGSEGPELPLRDGDAVLMGGVEMRFHDLAAGDTISGPVCSHCGRENSATDRDCWFCGTSLVSAASTLRARRPVVGRLVADDGQSIDLYDGQSATLDGGRPALREQGTAAGTGGEVMAADGRISLAQAGEGVLLNGKPASPAQDLATGDVVAVGGTSYLVIVR